ncbi:MAG: hypothetical protein J6Y37_15895 [Paludibacteraceae bacterium]|nr:hypothetical protein [Paludibacteraceae bacterium]
MKGRKNRNQVKRLFPLNQDDWTDEDYEAAIPEDVREGIDRAVKRYCLGNVIPDDTRKANRRDSP